jgi:hypothetical protein
MMDAEDCTFAEMAKIHFLYCRANFDVLEARPLINKHFQVVNFHAIERLRA